MVDGFCLFSLFLEAVSNGAPAVATETTETKEEAPAEVASDEAKPAENEEAKTEEVKTEEDKETKVETSSEPAPVPPPADGDEPTLSEEEAATKIQAIIRGKKARNEVKALKDSDDGKPVESKEAAVVTVESTEQPTEQPTATEGEEESDPKEQEAAAVKIQASFRGMKARKEVEAMKDTKQESEENTAVESGDAEKTEDN